MQQAKLTSIFWLFFTFLSVFTLTTCVKDYPLRITGNGETLVVVNAILNHTQNPDIDDYRIRLTKTQSVAGQSPVEIAILNAKPELVVNEKDVYPFTEQGNGFYEMLNQTIFKTRNTYKLRFMVGNARYESGAETLPDSVPIQKVYAELKEKPTALNTFDIIVDVQDKPEVRNYYNGQ
ncbi:MAG: DUF4249 domain-containing protein [Saprospiraceae bacterium]|nr:DUF4249 domain-containing protein [Saprospiraceae bacterium]